MKVHTWGLRDVCFFWTSFPERLLLTFACRTLDPRSGLIPIKNLQSKVVKSEKYNYLRKKVKSGKRVEMLIYVRIMLPLDELQCAASSILILQVEVIEAGNKCGKPQCEWLPLGQHFTLNGHHPATCLFNRTYNQKIINSANRKRMYMLNVFCKKKKEKHFIFTYHWQNMLLLKCDKDHMGLLLLPVVWPHGQGKMKLNVLKR